VTDSEGGVFITVQWTRFLLAEPQTILKRENSLTADPRTWSKYTYGTSSQMRAKICGDSLSAPTIRPFASRMAVSFRVSLNRGSLIGNRRSFRPASLLAYYPVVPHATASVS
jgi:hypothetical protein